ncbi:MAG: acetyl-CoA hydrolase/transferase C-terminal domain-containing protein [Limnobacter sp.]|nr:acetyl-CoA hydrolase/transferase C-terminal domain-containing protein [Limnobacter sp.]
MTEASSESRHQLFNAIEPCVDAIIQKVGKDIRIGMPLGLGKPVQLVNALYQRAKRDPSIQLTILTALSLEKPNPSNPVEATFMKQVVQRVFEGVPDLDYVVDQSKNRLPDNVTVKEFFFKPGSRLNNHQAQRDYISTNYTFAARDVFDQGCNVAAQWVCKKGSGDGLRYSLSCNPDTSPDLVDMLRDAQAKGQRNVAVIGQVNQALPYMGNDAEVLPDVFDYVIDTEPDNHTALFSTPKMAVTTPDYAIGLYASTLIKDGGTLQIGIGALGDAIVYALLQRQAENEKYLKVLDTFKGLSAHQNLIEQFGGTAPFKKGLYGATEMFVDGFWHLLKAGILSRCVYDFWALQKAVNAGECDPEQIDESVLDTFEALGVRVIRTKDFEVLKHHGFFTEDTQYDEGYIVAPDGTRVIANVADPATRKVLAEQCLGRRLKNGIALHGGFFLGPRDFYQGLHDLTDEERNCICMTSVYKINQLDHNPRLYKAQRIHARFMNTGIMVTLNGAVVSDGLEDNRVISGVGGQYNFVSMAHQLRTGRSVLMIRAVREKEGGEASSNIVFNYGHCTIPRHLRDLIITEYGIADLRGKTDRDIAKALINVADSRFQNELLGKAKQSGKIESEYSIPAQYCNNTPHALEKAIEPYQNEGLYPAFPFGTDLSEQDIALGKALRTVKAKSEQSNKVKLLLGALRPLKVPDRIQPFVDRMELTNPQSMKDKVLARLLVETLQEQGV